MVDGEPEPGRLAGIAPGRHGMADDEGPVPALRAVSLSDRTHSLAAVAARTIRLPVLERAVPVDSFASRIGAPMRALASIARLPERARLR